MKLAFLKETVKGAVIARISSTDQAWSGISPEGGAAAASGALMLTGEERAPVQADEFWRSLAPGELLQPGA